MARDTRKVGAHDEFSPSSLSPSALVNPVANEPPVVKLALNTWLVLRLHASSPSERTFGGLPNDFLNRGAAALLILDHAICDEDGLATEAAMPWVSTHIFERLKEEKLLRPTPFRSSYSPAVRERLESSGLLSRGRAIMQDHLRRLKEGVVGTEELELPAILRWLNSIMFAGLDLDNTLHYDYQDSHFANLSMNSHDVLAELAPSLSEVELARKHSRRTSLLLDVLDLVLPDFQLLPPISSLEARSALRENISNEKRMMYSYVYGDMPHPEYESFRSGQEFRRRDAIVDSIDRFKEADRNIETLLRVRARTKSIRPRAQSVISSVLNGRLSLESVRSELVTIRSTLDDALERESRVQDYHIIGGTYALHGVVEIIAVLSGHPESAVSALKSFAEAAREGHEASELQGQLKALGRRFPLAWIAAVHRRERRTRFPAEHLNP